MLGIPFLVAAALYLVVPALGALAVLRRWRGFRARVVESTLFPLLGYVGVRASRHSSRFRFYGVLEALEGKNHLWLKEEGGGISVRVNMKNQGYWMIPDTGEPPKVIRGSVPLSSPPPPPPRWIPWTDASALIQGTKFYVFGPLDTEEGQGTFHGTPERSLLVILYEGDPRDLVRRSVWTGRQPNEYWNSITPFSFALGLVLLSWLGYLWSRDPSTLDLARWTLALAVLPETFFLPPGLAFFYVFNRLWAKGRWYRAFRDMVNLPFRYWGAVPAGPEEGIQTTLPGGEAYRMCVNCRCAGESRRNAQEIHWSDSQDKVLYLVEGEGRDPAAVPAVFHGNPRALHGKAVKQARKGELLALMFFFAGAGINLGVLYLLFRSWLV